MPGAKEYRFTPHVGIVYVTSDLTIRGILPGRTGNVLKVVPPGTSLKYVGTISDGDIVGGNSLWYVSDEGNFFWSGNVTTTPPPQAPVVNETKILRAPLKKLVCTQRFGTRPEYYAKLGSPKGHNGVDFRTRAEDNPNNWKQDVVSVLGGVVIEATENEFNGKFVRVHHDNEYQSVYLHLSELAAKVGQRVESGTKIGVSGNSGGASEAPHLHFGYRPVKFNKDNGYMGYIDPLPYFIDPITFV